MILYALQAKDNSGKSTALKKLAASLLGGGARMQFCEPATSRSALVAQIASERRTRAAGGAEEVADVLLVLDADGVKVGVATDGGTPEKTAEALAAFEDAGCEVAFCAVRSKGAVQAMLEKYARKNTVYRVEKAVLENAQDFPAANRYMDELNDWQSGQLLRFLRGDAEK